jgi:hypothetical protein
MSLITEHRAGYKVIMSLCNYTKLLKSGRIANQVSLSMRIDHLEAAYGLHAVG